MAKRFVMGMVLFLASASAALAGSDATLSEESVPTPAPDLSLAGQRHYYAGAQSGEFGRVQKGMPEAFVKDLVGGTEFPGYETMRDGFTFALDPQHSQFFSFGGWMPPDDKHMDFFVAADEVLVVYYDSADVVTQSATYPRSKENVEYIKPGEKLGMVWPDSAATDTAGIFEK